MVSVSREQSKRGVNDMQLPKIVQSVLNKPSQGFQAAGNISKPTNWFGILVALAILYGLFVLVGGILANSPSPI